MGLRISPRRDDIDAVLVIRNARVEVTPTTAMPIELGEGVVYDLTDNDVRKGVVKTVPIKGQLTTYGEQSKTCNDCGFTKPLSEFGTRTKDGKIYSDSYCLLCRADRSRQWREENKEENDE